MNQAYQDYRSVQGQTVDCAPPSTSNLGNDVTHLSDTLNRLEGSIGTALERIRGPRPEAGGMNAKMADVSLRARLNQAEHAAERIESMAKELLSLIGE